MKVIIPSLFVVFFQTLYGKYIEIFQKRWYTLEVYYIFVMHNDK